MKAASKAKVAPKTTLHEVDTLPEIITNNMKLQILSCILGCHAV